MESVRDKDGKVTTVDDLARSDLTETFKKDEHSERQEECHDGEKDSLSQPNDLLIQSESSIKSGMTSAEESVSTPDSNSSMCDNQQPEIEPAASFRSCMFTTLDVTEAHPESCLDKQREDVDEKGLKVEHVETPHDPGSFSAHSSLDSTETSVVEEGAVSITETIPETEADVDGLTKNNFLPSNADIDPVICKRDEANSLGLHCMSPDDALLYVGDRGTFISDDAIEAAIRLMQSVVELEKLPIRIGNFLPNSEQQVALVSSDKNRTYLPQDKESINILLVDRASHWVTVSYQPEFGKILLYDSLEDQLRPTQILPLLQKMYQGINLVNIEYIPITQQPIDDPACGAFAVACALSKLLGHYPEEQNYIASQMREHLKECLIQGKLRLFPTKAKCPDDSEVVTKSGPELCPEKATKSVSQVCLVPEVAEIESRMSISSRSSSTRGTFSDDPKETVKLGPEMHQQKKTKSIPPISSSFPDASETEARQCKSSSSTNSRQSQLCFSIDMELVSCKYSVKKLNEFLRIVCGLVNSREGGQVSLKNLDFNPDLDGPPGLDDFHQKTDESLYNIISGTGTQYADVFKWKWQEGKGEYLILNVKPVDEICAVDFRTKSSLTKGREKEDRNFLLSLLKMPAPECYMPVPPALEREFTLNANIPEISESVQVQLKHYQGCKTDKNLKTKLEHDLRDYLSAFTKVDEGGQVFIGLDEVSEKDRKWEKDFKKGAGKQTYCKGQVIENLDNIRQYIEYLVLQRMCWLRSDGSVLCDSDVKKYVRTTFHPVLNRDGQPIDKTYVIEISVAKFYGVVFTSKDGPEAVKISPDGSLCNFAVVEWWNEMLGKDFKELQRKLVELYSEKCSKVEVSPLDGINIPIDKIYTEVVIVEETVADLEKQGEKKQIEKKLPSFKDIFFNGKDRRKNIAILGPAGRGKTTWCRQLANLWSKVHGAEQMLEIGKDHVFEEESLSDYNIYLFMLFNTGVYPMSDYFFRKQQEQFFFRKQQEQFEKCEIMRHFEYLFLIQLRLLEKPISVYDAICSTLLNECSDLNETIKKVLKNYPEKVLVICDGLDEYCHKKPPSREHLHGCTVLTTTRPWQYESIRRSCDKPDIVLQLKGFDEFGVFELTQNILMHLNGIEGKNKAIEFLNEIRSIGLVETAKIPLILTYLVHLWYNTKNKLSKSLTVNLIELLVCIIRKGEERIEDMPDLSKLKDKWSKVKLPGKLYDETELEPYGALLLCIAELAFQGLILSDTQNSLIFRGRNLMKHFQDDLELEVCLKFGLLSKSEIIYDGRKSTAVSFYHKLVQEFFTAVYAVFSEDAFEKLCHFCCTLDGVFDSENIYLFICGIDPQVGAKFSKHVAEVMSMDTKVKRWRKEIVKNSVSPDYELGWCIYSDKVHRMSVLNTSCLKEIDHSNKRSGQTFYVTDVCFIFNFITDLYSKPKDFNLYLLCNAIQTVVYLQIVRIKLTKQEGEMLVQVICESPSLQAVGLCNIRIDGTTEVTHQMHNVKSNKSSSSILRSVHLRKVPASLAFALITNLKRATTVTQRENNGSSVAYIGGLTTGSTGTLTKLILSSLTMTRREWDMLMNLVSESPSLQTLELWKITVDGCLLHVSDVCIGTSSHSAKLKEVTAPLLPLLTFIGRITTVPQQDNSTSGTRSNVDSIHYLEVYDVKMTRCEWDMLMNIVSESHSLQTLELRKIIMDRCLYVDRVSIGTSFHSAELNNVRVPLLPLLTFVRRITTVPQQDNSTSGTRINVGSIHYLTLYDVTMTRCEWDMLVNIVSESPSLQLLKLWKITVDRCWYVRRVSMGTSSHSAELNDVRVPLLPLLTFGRRKTTVPQQDDSTSGTRSNVGSIHYLTLYDVTMTRCEWDMLVNIVSESPSLQLLKLWKITVDGCLYVRRVSMGTSSHSAELIDVRVPLLPLLTIGRRKTTVPQQDDSTSGTRSNVGSIHYLTLYDVTMTRCEWDMLVNIVSESPSLQKLDLCDISINDHAASDNVPGHDISSHPALSNVSGSLLPQPTPVSNTAVTQGSSFIHNDTTQRLASVARLNMSNVTITRDEWDMLRSIFSESFYRFPIIIDEQDAGDNVTVYDLYAETFHSPKRHVILRQVCAPMLQLLTCFTQKK